MLCKIADLLVEIPGDGGMDSRCQDYLVNSEQKADIVIRKELYNLDRWEKLSYDNSVYMESGGFFYSSLLLNNGMMLHSSAIEYEGKAYLFSGPSGMGKSTHTRLWREVLGDGVRVFNDDKPALRLIDGVWYAYGTPWSGKDGININTRVPLAGICFLRRGDSNSIRRLSPIEATSAVMTQTLNRFQTEKGMGVLMDIVEKLVTKIPVHVLSCLPNEEAAKLSYETMKRAAQEENL